MAKGKYQPLYDLGEDRLLTIEGLLRQGMAASHVARQLHKAGVFLDLTLRKVSRLLTDYKKDVLDRALMRSIDEAGILKHQKMGHQLNVHEEMMTNLAVQRNRVERAVKAMGMNPDILIESHGRELERYGNMLDKVARIQMDVGIIPKAPRRVTTQMIRDENNPNMVRMEVTEETLQAAEEAEQLFGGDLLALPAPIEADPSAG